jgi:methylmalonyl-CoA/ethylmalonyl-CoA epimerase
MKPEYNPFGDTAEFDHIGIVVGSIENIGIKTGDIFHDPIQKAKVAFICVHGFRVEFIEPATEDSPVINKLKQGEKLVHMCFRTSNLSIALKNARKSGFHPMSRPKPAVAFDNRKIVWLYSKVFGLIELVEE